MQTQKVPSWVQNQDLLAVEATHCMCKQDIPNTLAISSLSGRDM